MIRKIVLTITLFVLIFMVGAPLYLYNKSLSYLNSFPEPIESSSLTKKEVSDYWKSTEPKVALETYSSITPYWIYSWLVSAIANDYLGYSEMDAYAHTSVMAGSIAINHMRTKGNLKNIEGMFWWHLLHSSLAVHIQRNWSAEEIVDKYRAINL